MSELIDLSEVTLVCFNGVNPEMGVKALRYSMKDIRFAKAILFTDRRPANLGEDIELVLLPKIDFTTSCIFSLKGFLPFVNTKFCLSIHDDGFVINPHLWDSQFLNYDYIGAPWVVGHKHRVGNGGFCLKSRRFMEICQEIPWQGEHDDALTCMTYHDYFIAKECTFAPVEVAMKFALESKIPECEYNLDNCFGFHGKGEGDHFGGEGQQFKDKIKLLDNVN